jgi:hypothetical protein
MGKREISKRRYQQLTLLFVLMFFFGWCGIFLVDKDALNIIYRLILVLYFFISFLGIMCLNLFTTEQK